MELFKSISKFNFRFITLCAALTFIAVPIISSTPATAQSALYNKSSNNTGSNTGSVALFNRSDNSNKSAKSPVFFNQKYAKAASQSKGYEANIYGNYGNAGSPHDKIEGLSLEARQNAAQSIRQAAEEYARKSRAKLDAEKRAEARKELMQQQQKKGFATPQNRNNYQQNTADAAPIVKYVYRR